jgi:hypothetical protein
MQPTADSWMLDEEGKSCSERVCYSPWLGRDWILQANGGRGPLWSEYWHFFVDEELQEVAKRQGVLWQRPDLIHYHNHWSRAGEKRPPHLLTKDRPEKWQQAKALFEQRRDAGFPGSARKVS